MAIVFFIILNVIFSSHCMPSQIVMIVHSPLLCSSGYVAPEILRSPVSNGYKNNVDIFSAGVTLYVLLCGYEPFYGECDTELIASNRKASVEYPDEDWRRSGFYLLAS